MSRSRFCRIAVSAWLLFAFLSPFVALADEAPAAPKPAAVVSAAAEAGTAAVQAAAPETKPAAPAAAEATAEEAKEEEHNWFYGKWWALVPPLLAIILALITKEVYSSLFMGIVVGGCFAGEGNFLKIMDFIVKDGFIKAVEGTAGVFIFLVVLGILVALMNRTGATQAFGAWAQKHVKSRIGAQLMTFLLGVLIFIDDYFNCLTVGSVMMPVTDSKKISRAKLAFLIDATAAPICMIAPISSWAAAVADYTKGTGYNGIQLFCRAIPFNFYSLLMILFILAITFLKLDFGLMAKHERNAIEKGDLFTEGGEVDNGIKDNAAKKGTIADLVLPVLLLIVICFFALLYVGEYGKLLDDGTRKGFIAAFGDTDAAVALPWGGMLSLFIIILYYIGRNFFAKNPERPFMPYAISSKEAMGCIAAGFNAMVPAILILTMAATLKNMTGLLGAKEFIAGMMNNAAPTLHKLLPCVIFLVACVLAFATGTSWGTFGILIPIVTSMFDGTNPLLIISMSACLAGAVCGDHCSPISDTTIMSSAGARCEHINHVSTQLPYAIFVAAVSAVGFLLAGFIQNWYVVFPITVVLMIVALYVIKGLKKVE